MAHAESAGEGVGGGGLLSPATYYAIDGTKFVAKDASNEINPDNIQKKIDVVVDDAQIFLKYFKNYMVNNKIWSTEAININGKTLSQDFQNLDEEIDIVSNSIKGKFVPLSKAAVRKHNELQREYNNLALNLKKRKDFQINKNEKES